MEHIYKRGAHNQPVYVLLHGTGGDETSLLSVADYLNPEASILSVRGTVKENGANRYFKRLAEGVYDEEDLYARGEELRSFIVQASQEYAFHLADVVLVGFSNGANIAINLLLQNQSEFKRAILMAPMYPVDTSHLTEDKTDMRVFVSMGRFDPICTVADSLNVVSLFEDRRAHVTQVWTQTHEVTRDILDQAKIWLAQ